MPIYSYKIAIAGLTLSLDCADKALHQRLARHYAAFHSQQSIDLALPITWRTSPTDASAPGAYDFTFNSGRLIFALADYSGEIDLAAHSLRLDVCTPAPMTGIDYFLRAVYALWLFETGGLLLHSAGLVRDEQAYLFFGHSGSGKTTVSRLSPEAIVLNDDLVALRPTQDGWIAHTTPFWNPTQVHPSPHAAPLAGMFRLVQDQSVWLEDISLAAAVAELASSTPVISADGMRSAPLMMRCAQLARQVGVKRLHFRKDATFWQVIHNLPRGNAS